MEASDRAKALCADCISRQAAIDAINNHFGFNIEEEYGSAVQEVINGLPSAQPDTGKATWAIHTYMPHNYYCTNCKQDSPYNKIWDFCPHCGFKMEDYV